MTAPTLDRESILRAVEQWPLPDQIALADAILEQAGQLRGAPNSFMALRGIAAAGQPAPTDEDVERILDEERMRRYGN